MLKKCFILILLAIELANLAYASDEGVTPLFLYGEWDKIKYFTNLTPSKDNYTLDLDQYDNGFIINRKRRIGLATGYVGRLSETTALSEIGPDIGLAPVVKSYATFVSHVDNIKEGEELIQIIPINETDLNKYKIDDSAMFELKGGLVFNIGLAAGMSHIGGKVYVAGGFSTYVRKVSEDTIYVEIRKIYEKNRSFYANITIPYYERGSITDDAIGFGYLINYKNKEGIKAYRNFLEGRIDLVHEIDGTITSMNHINSHKLSLVRGFGFGIPYVPFLNASIIRENSTRDEMIIDENNIEKKQKYVLSLKRRDISFLLYRRIVDTSFLIFEENNQTKMQLYFKDATNFSKSKKINAVKEMLSEITGLSDFVDFTIKKHEKLNFAEVQLAVDLGDSIVDAIKNKHEKLKDYFLSDANANKTDIEDMLQQLKKHSHSYNELASFGQSFWNTKELFQMQLKLVEICGGKISFEVSGKRISRIVRTKSFQKLDECPL